MSSKAGLPSYEPMLAAYHRAFAVELRAMVGVLPIAEGQSVLDMACGDGVYSPWLAERVGASGRVVAVDVRGEYLELARKHAASSPGSGIIEFQAASIDALPFPDHSFDLCWCAQSLYSLPDPVEALGHLCRVTKPGGVVAVLEGDTLHRVILPWRVDLELAVQAAERVALKKKSDKPGRYYVGRQLRRVCREAGLEWIAYGPSRPIAWRHSSRTTARFSRSIWPISRAECRSISTSRFAVSLTNWSTRIRMIFCSMTPTSRRPALTRSSGAGSLDEREPSRSLRECVLAHGQLPAPGW